MPSCGPQAQRTLMRQPALNASPRVSIDTKTNHARGVEVLSILPLRRLRSQFRLKAITRSMSVIKSRSFVALLHIRWLHLAEDNKKTGQVPQDSVGFAIRSTPHPSEPGNPCRASQRLSDA